MAGGPTFNHIGTMQGLKRDVRFVMTPFGWVVNRGPSMNGRRTVAIPLPEPLPFLIGGIDRLDRSRERRVGVAVAKWRSERSLTKTTKRQNTLRTSEIRWGSDHDLFTPSSAEGKADRSRRPETQAIWVQAPFLFLSSSLPFQGRGSERKRSRNSSCPLRRLESWSPASDLRHLDGNLQAHPPLGSGEGDDLRGGRSSQCAGKKAIKKRRMEALPPRTLFLAVAMAARDVRGAAARSSDGERSVRSLDLRLEQVGAARLSEA